MAQAAFDEELGWQADAFTVIELQRGDAPPTYKAVWGSSVCCYGGHRSVKAAADHGARINRDRAMNAWKRKRPDVFMRKVEVAQGNYDREGY